MISLTVPNRSNYSVSLDFQVNSASFAVQDLSVTVKPYNQGGITVINAERVDAGLAEFPKVIA